MATKVKTSVITNLVDPNKKKCEAYVKFNTIGKAFDAVNDGQSVYLVKESHNIKPSAFCRCSKTTENKNGLCHIHEKSSQSKKYDTDILPQSDNDSLRWKATIKDPYFDNMGKRGAKKKNIQNSYNFPQKDDTIKEVLEHKDKKLKILLYAYAAQLLKNNFKIPEEKDNSKKIEKSLNNELNKALDTIYSKIPPDKESDDDKESLSDNDEEESEDDDEDEVECVDIYTLNENKHLWYNKENNTVYVPEGENGGEEIGILKEINKKFHTILFETKMYTVIEYMEHKKYKRINCCVITNKLFNDKYEHIGNRKKIDINKYEMVFFNEI